MPGKGELFLNHRAMAIGDLKVNTTTLTPDSQSFKNQKIFLEESTLKVGWNAVEMRWISRYNRN